MELKVCKNCRRLFRYIFGAEICQDCMKLVPNENRNGEHKFASKLLKPKVLAEEEQYEQVKDYIMKHPNATVVQIAEDNKLEVTKLLEWVREDRLEFSENSKNAWFECSHCGAKIKSGRLCNRCKVR